MTTTTEMIIKYKARGQSEQFETDRCTVVIHPHPNNTGCYRVHLKDEHGDHWIARQVGGDPIRSKAEARDWAMRTIVDIERSASLRAMRQQRRLTI